jgi:hypothetical protein
MVRSCNHKNNLFLQKRHSFEDNIISLRLAMLIRCVSLALGLLVFTGDPVHGMNPPYIPAQNLSRLAILMPQSTLAAPSDQLKYVVLGMGTQNYTCQSNTPGDAPGTTGAVGE